MRKLALAPKTPSSDADVDTIVAAGAPLNTCQGILAGKSQPVAQLRALT